MLHDLYNWMEGLALSPFATWLLFLIAFAESIIFPIPPDALLIAMGMINPEYAFWYATLCSVASVLGGGGGYAIGYYGGRPVLERWISTERLTKIQGYFNRYDAWAIIIAGFTPIPYKIFTIASGAFKVNFKTFMIASAIGRSGRFFLVATFIYFLGPKAKVFIQENLNSITLISGAVLILGVLAYYFFKKKKKTSESHAS